MAMVTHEPVPQIQAAWSRLPVETQRQLVGFLRRIAEAEANVSADLAARTPYYKRSEEAVRHSHGAEAAAEWADLLEHLQGRAAA